VQLDTLRDNHDVIIPANTTNSDSLTSRNKDKSQCLVNNITENKSTDFKPMTDISTRFHPITVGPSFLSGFLPRILFSVDAYECFKFHILPLPLRILKPSLGFLVLLGFWFSVLFVSYQFLIMYFKLSAF